MKIMDFIKIHYNQCMKDYLYIGISLVFLAVFLRISFWGLYTTETRDITYDDDSFWVQVDNGNFTMHNGLVTSGWEWIKFNPETGKYAFGTGNILNGNR